MLLALFAGDNKEDFVHYFSSLFCIFLLAFFVLEELGDRKAILLSKSFLNQGQSSSCEPKETSSSYAWVKGNR